MLMAGATASAQTAYTNPVIDSSAPDPSVIRADDGTFYLYATENIRNTPIFHSADLVHWNLVGTAFTDETRPGWLPDGGIWAPDINKIGDDYVMYYSKSVWGGIWDAGIGVAVSRKPEGPFVDKGNIIQSRAIGVCNSIDPFYIEDQGRKYLFWGSFRGIFGVELAANGLHLKADFKPVQIAGTFMEATYIHRRGGYYYLFGSAGTCCEGNKSTYHITVGRSKNLFGPYVDKDGKPLMENHYETVLAGNADVAGPGHNAEMLEYEKRTLQDYYDVVLAANGQEALSILEREKVSLVVTDVMMAPINGFELCRNIKKNVNYSHTPVILLTAATLDLARMEGMESGADAYIEKPFSMEFLINTITNLLRSREEIKRTYAGSPFVSSNTVAKSNVDKEFLERLRSVMQRHMSNSEFNVDQLASGMNMSRSNLNRKVRGTLNVSPNTYIRIERLKYAAQLLKAGDCKINEVCYKVGFNNSGYFTKCFYAQFGILPKDFIKSS